MDQATMKHAIVPRDYQIEAVQLLFNYLQEYGGNPIVAMPTATGKSVVIAEFCRWVNYYSPRARILCLTHVKELIDQNYNKLKQVAPDVGAAVFSAGLRRKELGDCVTFGGVASVKNSINIFGWIDFILIDECHLLSPKHEGMYQTIISILTDINPKLRVIGFTATPYRMKQGMLTDNGIFTDIVVDYTRIEHFGRFIAAGHLVPVIPKRTDVNIDLSDVGTIGGEFNIKQLDAVTSKYELMHAALKELAEQGRDRRRWLIFNTSVENAKQAAAILGGWGIPTQAVYHGMEDEERAKALRDFHDYKLRAISNYGILTTGYDEPGIDLIGMLRATRSVALWVQMLGRGMRPAPWEGKRNCLVLDFAGNAKRLGPVDDPNIPGRPSSGASGDLPLKICETCACYQHISKRVCEFCGAEFVFREKITKTASTSPLMQEPPHVDIVTVQHVAYFKHVKRDTGNVTLKVVYHTSLTEHISEYVGIEQKSRRAYQWWAQRSADLMPDTTDEALKLTPMFRVPTRLHVWRNTSSRYPEILRVEWD